MLTDSPMISTVVAVMLWYYLELWYYLGQGKVFYSHPGPNGELHDNLLTF